MIGFFVLTLFQAAAGEPAPPPAPAAPAAEQGAETSATASTSDADAAENRVRCRNVVSIGSRIPTRRCTTVAQDRERAEQDQRSTQDIQRGGLIGGSQGN